MSESLIYITERFKGSFVTEPLEIQQKLSKIKAFVFDWDGVFNNGFKNASGSSPFSEVDAMGTNMIRFNHCLRNNVNPFVAIISGESNTAAFTLAKREHFHSVYCSIKHKMDALDHFCKTHNLKYEEVAFVFDDILDLSVAKVVGLRIMVSRACNPLLIDFAVQHNMVDYLTANEGNHHAVRETAELIVGLSGLYHETLENRIDYTATYQEYLGRRNNQQTMYYTCHESKIIEHRLK